MGTAQHLKGKFGKGYLLETKAPEDKTQGVEAFIKKHYPSAELVDAYGEMRNFAIPQGGLKLSEAFSLLEENKPLLGIFDYSLSQASLEQVFLRFAKHQVDEDTDTHAAPETHQAVLRQSSVGPLKWANSD